MRMSALLLLAGTCSIASVLASSPGQPLDVPDCGPGLAWMKDAGCVTLPQIVSRAKPEFPEFKYDGPVKVMMEVTIDQRGRVKEARPIEPLAPKAYETEALKAVRRWSYKPARDASGKAVQVKMVVSISFSMG